MRRITTWLLSTISALVLLFSYHTSTNASEATTVVAQGDDGTASAGPSAPGSTDSGSSSPSASSPSAPAPPRATTSTGAAVSTRYGDVQVRITVKDGTITAAKATRVPWTNGKDRAINGRAVPILNEEVVAGQSAAIDMVSGATYTSEGYLASLQSAIDKANL